MNKARIVRDNYNVYLEVIGHPLDKPIYFKIEQYSDKEKLKIKALTKEFDIDLSGRK